MPNYEVLHGGFGRYAQGDVITEAQAGAHIERALSLGAIRPTGADPTYPDAAPPAAAVTDTGRRDDAEIEALHARIADLEAQLTQKAGKLKKDTSLDSAKDTPPPNQEPK